MKNQLRCEGSESRARGFYARYGHGPVPAKRLRRCSTGSGERGCGCWGRAQEEWVAGRRARQKRRLGRVEIVGGGRAW